MNIQRMTAIVKAHGFSVDSTRKSSVADGEDYDDVMTPEASFYRNLATGETEVVMWSGSYPFVNDHPMGNLPTLEDAVRYAAWLLKREAFYYERDEAKWEEANV